MVLASLFLCFVVSLVACFFGSMCVGVFLCFFAWGTFIFGLQGRNEISSLFLRLESFDLVPAVAWAVRDDDAYPCPGSDALASMAEN